MLITDSTKMKAPAPAPVAPWKVKAEEWSFYYEEAGQAFLHHVRLICPTLKDQVTMIGQFISMASSLREYAINQVEDVKPLWSTLRSDTRYVDCLMGTTASFFQGCVLSVSEVAKAMSEAIHVIYPVEGSASVPVIWTVPDNSFRESLGLQVSLNDLFVANPWLMIFIMIKRSGALSLSAEARVGNSTKAG